MTPAFGGRVFEKGEEKILRFAHENQGACFTSRLIPLQTTGDYQSVPIVIVFTQYDRLVRTKEFRLWEEYPDMDPTHRHERSVEEARKAFEMCLESLQLTMDRLGIPMPPCTIVSGKLQIYLRRCTIWY